MHLSFVKVSRSDSDKIEVIYNILKKSGEHMYKEEGLTHWRNPYPIESIKRDCENGKVFLVKDNDTDLYVHTFQLKILEEQEDDLSIKRKIAYINKFATIPTFSGKGIGKQSMNFIESYCREKLVSKIALDVYDKSIGAIQFYKKRGFKIIGSKPTRYFTVKIMEKNLNV